MRLHSSFHPRLRLSAAEPKAASEPYVPEMYFQEKEQSLQYLKERHMVGDEHAGADATSEIMFIDAAMGKVFIGFKVSDAVAQIRAYRQSKP